MSSKSNGNDILIISKATFSCSSLMSDVPSDDVPSDDVSSNDVSSNDVFDIDYGHTKLRNKRSEDFYIFSDKFLSCVWRFHPSFKKSIDFQRFDITFI